MEAETSLQCPWCWEWIELYLPSDSHGDLIEDCEVCCRPWLIQVSQNEDGSRTIQISRSN